MPMLRSLLEPEDDAATRAFFTELLTEPMPPPRVPPSPRGPERVWRPPLDQTGTPLGTLIERHPAYGWGLEDLPVMTVRQAHRTNIPAALCAIEMAILRPRRVERARAPDRAAK